MEHADERYLEAKRTVDERALDRRVRDRLRDELPTAPRVREVGVGTGVTVPRLLDWGVVAGDYVGVDRDAEVIEFARERRASECGGEPIEGGFQVADLTVRFEAKDGLTAFDGDEADLLVAQAVLDLVPIDDALDAFVSALTPGGLVYAPITFDGETIFQPDHPADDAVTAAYHDAIDAEPGRDTRAGRHLLDRCRARDGELLAAGASDWVVYPPYPADERYFLSTILDFVAETVAGRVDGADDWLRTRRRQLDAGRLSYVAHGYDVLYRAPE
jgi:hypothetical protein